MRSLLSRAARACAVPALLVLLVAAPGCMMARPASSGGSGGGMATLILQNRTATAVHYVYISPCSSDGWGSDRLNSSEVVMPGNQRSFALETGCWDAKAKFSDGREVEERGVALVAGYSRTWTVSGN